MVRLIGCIALLVLPSVGLGQTRSRAGISERSLESRSPEVVEVGEDSAREYFTTRSTRAVAGRAPSESDRLLMLHIGGYLDGDAYEWGPGGKVRNAGRNTFGVGYRVGEWVNSMDLIFRADFNTYSLAQGESLKLSLVPVIVFPDAASRFPLYFGGGIGPGIFFRQLENESNLSLDYQLFAGARFFNVYQTVGFTVEGGLKNHLHLLSSGQFNGTYFSLGTVFVF